MTQPTIIVAYEEPVPVPADMQRQLDAFRADILEQTCDVLQRMIDSNRLLIERLRAGMQ